MRRLIGIALSLALVFGCSPQEVLPDLDRPQEDPAQNEAPVQNNNDDTPVVRDIPVLPVLAPQVSGSVGAVSLTPEQMAYNNAAGKLAFRVLDKLYQGESFVFSPLSLQMALSMTLNGAEGETEQEMLDVLGFGREGAAALNAYGKSLLEQLPAVDASVNMQMADAVIANENYLIVPDFQKLVGEMYYASVANMPFDDGQGVKKVVNDWCSQSTKGLIPEILDDVSTSAMAYLLNALYFKAGWSTPFDPDYQVKPEQPFYGANSTVKIDFLATGESLPYLEGDSFRMVTRPFGEKSVYEMAILLPNEKSTLADVVKECQAKAWNDLLAQQKGTLVHLEVPKFQTESAHELNETLMQLGMKRAFSDNAQFGRMFVKGEACISRVFQKAKLALDENGVEAAAATVVEIMATSPGPGTVVEYVPFVADHPFVYAIFERSSGTILFAGIFDGK